VYNYKILITYDGTNYCGWQIQPNGPTIQEKLQAAIKILCKIPVCVIGSGRTDAGVHAVGQAAHFMVPIDLDLFRFQGSLNALLPPDIRVKEIQPVPLDFHAQYSAKSKIYHYHIYLERFQDPFKRLYSWLFLEKFDCHLLKETLPYFIGTHDFTSFANEAHTGSAKHDAVRTLQRLEIFPEEGGIRLEFQADGFLYKMVRNIVGTLVEVATGKRLAREIPDILLAKDRRVAGMAAPPHGLFLMHVEYAINCWKNGGASF
jgi:tRNA pseudouridine38-40 synthase